MSKFVFVASPYIGSDEGASVEENLALHIKVGNDLLDVGLFPLLPLVTGHSCGLIILRHEVIWREFAIALLSKADALYRVGGWSMGADLEVAHAVEKNIPVFTPPSDVVSIVNYFKERKDEKR